MLSTLKWDIWSSMELNRREDIPADYEKDFVNGKIKEWTSLSYEDFLDAIYKRKNITAPKEVYKSLKKIKANKNNAFLYDKRQKGNMLQYLTK